MKLEELFKHISKKTADDIYVDIGQVIHSDEFHKKAPRSRPIEETSVNRCLDMNVDFCTNSNTIFRTFQRFFVAKCPRCGKDMTAGHGSGNGYAETIYYDCVCGGKMSVTVPPDGICIQRVEGKE